MIPVLEELIPEIIIFKSFLKDRRILLGRPRGQDRQRDDMGIWFSLTSEGSNIVDILQLSITSHLLSVLPTLHISSKSASLKFCCMFPLFSIPSIDFTISH